MAISFHVDSQPQRKAYVPLATHSLLGMWLRWERAPRGTVPGGSGLQVLQEIRDPQRARAVDPGPGYGHEAGWQPEIARHLETGQSFPEFSRLFPEQPHSGRA